MMLVSQVETPKSVDPEKASLLVNEENETEEKSIELDEKMLEVNSLGVRYNSPTEGLEYRQALKNPILYLIMLILTLAGSAPSTITSFYKVISL